MRLEKRLTAATLLAQGLVGRTIVINYHRHQRRRFMRRSITAAELSGDNDLLLKLSGRNISLGVLVLLSTGERADVYISRFDSHGLFDDGSIVVDGSLEEMHILPSGKTSGSNRTRMQETLKMLQMQPLDGSDLFRLVYDDFVTRLGIRSFWLAEAVRSEYACGVASNTQPRPEYLFYERLDVVQVNGQRWITAKSRPGFYYSEPSDIVAVRLPDDFPDKPANWQIEEHFVANCGNYFRNSLFVMNYWGIVYRFTQGESVFLAALREKLEESVGEEVVDEQVLTDADSPYRKAPGVIYGVRFWPNAISWISETLEAVLIEVDSPKPADVPLAA